MTSSSPYWSMSITDPKAIVEGLDDLRQCLMVILKTAKGSDPLRPDFGADIYKAVDLPDSRVAPLLKRSILEQVALYEPRVIVESITLAVKEPGHIAVSLTWSAKAETRAQAQNLYAEFLR